MVAFSGMTPHDCQVPEKERETTKVDQYRKFGRQGELGHVIFEIEQTDISSYQDDRHDGEFLFCGKILRSKLYAVSSVDTVDELLVE